jgi:hypothetical protein
MAFVAPFPKGGNPDESPAVFYNVSMAVGPGCPNMREDVMLVQFLLALLYADPTLTRPSPDKLKVDGVFGPITEKWILGYQRDAVRHGLAVKVDGRVDRALGLEGSISHTIYTILSLTASVYRRQPFLFKALGAIAEYMPPFLMAIRRRAESLTGAMGGAA